MSDVMRWRWGETNPVVVAVDSSTVIEVGDLLYLDTDDAKPASSQTDQSSLTANQELFKDNFLGVAMQRSASGDTDPIRVATTGVFEFACASATHEIGNLIGACENSGGTALEDQKVVKTTIGTNYAIGICAQREATATTRVLVDIRSTTFGHGILAGTESTAI